ncbi:MAG: hypothetical protein JXA30_15805 [Deltaproteobacteria bacterium]|nr:hypothetical protein [Deltaproteobacteria bacterium]
MKSLRKTGRWLLFAPFLFAAACGGGSSSAANGDNDARSKIDYGGSSFLSNQKESRDKNETDIIYRHMRVRGITGSLNRGDVHDIMATRSNHLLDCVAKRPQHLRFVNGVIAFHFLIGPRGEVLDVYPSRSDVGYYELERCLAEVVEQTRFMAPCGREKTELDWDMRVEKDWDSDPESLYPGAMRRALERHSAEIYESCKIKRKIRFYVTAYIDPDGHVLSCGLVPNKRVDSEKIECLVGEIMQWRVPKPKNISKVGFRLRWLPPPSERLEKRAGRRSGR